MALDLDAAELPADAIEVGRITDAWGVKGWFKILPYSADPEALLSSKRWFLLPPDRRRTVLGMSQTGGHRGKKSLRFSGGLSAWRPRPNYS